MGATVLTVGEIFSDRYQLELPYFQRGYAWQEEHVGRLLANLREAAARGGAGWHTLGVIIVVHRAGEVRAGITDGHQRLITLTLLLAVLRDLEGDAELRRRLASHIAGADGRLRLTTAKAGQTALAAFVQNDGATSVPTPESASRSDSEANIIANRDWLREKLANGDIDAAERRRLAELVLDHCHLAVVSVEDEAAARLLFTTMHDTGLRPEPSDLMKAEVLGCIEPDERAERQAIWESHEARLGREGLARLLRDIATIGTGEIVKKEAPRTLFEHFALDQPGNARRFIDERIGPLGDCLARVMGAPHRVGVADGGISRRIAYLVDLVTAHDTWRAPLLAWLEKHGGDDAQTAEFMRRFEPRAFMNQLLGIEPQDRERVYLALIDEIRAGTALTTGRALAISDAERREAIAVLTKDGNAKRRNVQLLLRINGAIDGDDRIVAVPRASIEHVFPKRPRQSSNWLTDFATPAAEALRGTLGNLALFTDGEQNEAKNRDWSEKRAVLAKSPFAVTRRAAERTTWRPEDVVARSRELADILLRSFGLAGT